MKCIPGDLVITSIILTTQSLIKTANDNRFSLQFGACEEIFLSIIIQKELSSKILKKFRDLSTENLLRTAVPGVMVDVNSTALPVLH